MDPDRQRDRERRILEAKNAVKAYLEVTGVAGRWGSAFLSIRQNDDLAESFLDDLKRLLMLLESELESDDEELARPADGLETLRVGTRAEVRDTVQAGGPGPELLDSAVDEEDIVDEDELMEATPVPSPVAPPVRTATLPGPPGLRPPRPADVPAAPAPVATAPPAPAAAAAPAAAPTPEAKGIEPPPADARPAGGRPLAPSRPLGRLAEPRTTSPGVGPPSPVASRPAGLAGTAPRGALATAGRTAPASGGASTPPVAASPAAPAAASPAAPPPDAPAATPQAEAALDPAAPASQGSGRAPLAGMVGRGEGRDVRATERVPAALLRSMQREAAARKAAPAAPAAPAAVPAAPAAPARPGFIEASTQLSGPPAFTEDKTDQTVLPPGPVKPGSFRR